MNWVNHFTAGLNQESNETKKRLEYELSCTQQLRRTTPFVYKFELKMLADSSVETYLGVETNQGAASTYNFGSYNHSFIGFNYSLLSVTVKELSHSLLSIDCDCWKTLQRISSGNNTAPNLLVYFNYQHCVLRQFQGATCCESETQWIVSSNKK